MDPHRNPWLRDGLSHFCCLLAFSTASSGQGLLETSVEELPTFREPFVDFAPNFGAPAAEPISFREDLPPPLDQKGNSCVGFTVGYGLGTFLNEGAPTSPYFTYYWAVVSDGRPLMDRGSKFEPAFLSFGSQGFCQFDDYVRTFNPETGKEIEPDRNLIAHAKQSKRMVIPQLLAHRGLAEEMRKELANGRVIPCGFRYYENFSTIGADGDGGVLTDMRVRKSGKAVPVWTRAGNPAGLHAMLVTGYDPHLNAFEALNSHGLGFGDEGYIWIDADFMEDTGPDPDDPFDNPCCVLPYTYVEFDPSIATTTPLATGEPAGGGWARLIGPIKNQSAIPPGALNFCMPGQLPILDVGGLKPDDVIEVKIGINRLFVRSGVALLGSGSNTTSAPPLGTLRRRDRFRISDLQWVHTSECRKFGCTRQQCTTHRKYECWIKGRRID